MNCTEDDRTLKEGLCDESDYYLLPELAWNKFVAWYGVSDNQVIYRCPLSNYLGDIKEKDKSNWWNVGLELLIDLVSVLVACGPMYLIFVIVLHAHTTKDYAWSERVP